MEASARKSLHLLAFQFQVSKASPCLTMKPNKTMAKLRVVQQLSSGLGDWNLLLQLVSRISC
jgi:hypothetical protein